MAQSFRRSLGFCRVREERKQGLCQKDEGVNLFSMYFVKVLKQTTCGNKKIEMGGRIAWPHGGTAEDGSTLEPSRFNA